MDSSETNQLRDTFGKIVGCIQQGKLAEAEALAQQILRIIRTSQIYCVYWASP